MSDELRRAQEIIDVADALVIAAGAGMGVDSGLPDFRGIQGFWRAYPALARARMDFATVASPQTFVEDPRLAWGFYGHRLGLYRDTEPHSGFEILKQWAESKPLGARVFTSNVDGQFQKAGFAESGITECHGSIHHLQCVDGCSSDIWSADGFVPEVDVESCRLMNDPPLCPKCGSLARPNILMFGDWAWVFERTDAQMRREASWLSELVDARGNVAIVELGAGTAIPSVRMFNQQLISELGARLVRINIRESRVPSTLDVGLALGARDALVSLLSRGD